MALIWTDIAEGRDQASFYVMGSGAGNYSTLGGRESMARMAWPFPNADRDDGVTVGLSVYHTITDPHDTLLQFEGDGGTVDHLTLDCDPAMKRYRIYRGLPATGVLLGSSDPNTMPGNVWTHLEMKVKVADSGGSVELRREESTIILLTGIDTRNGGTDALIDRVNFVEPGSGQNLESRFTDAHIITEAGASPTSFVGHHRGYWLDPTSQGNYNEQPGSDGNSTDTHLLVDELGVPDDADYYGSATDGARQTFGMRDLAPTVGSVLSMMIRARNIKTDAGAKKLRSLIRRAGTDVAGADWIIDVVGDSDYTLYPTDPVAAAAWTVANVNSTELGTEVRP